MLIATNFTGHPCPHLRAGFSDVPTRADPWFADLGVRSGEQGARVPHGISLWSPLFEEGRLRNLGMALEAALGVAEVRPPL